MENTNNNNGRGIFYGVIGVATLVVAIIGATFAFFTASASSNNAIKVGSTRVELDIISEQKNLKDNLIPVDAMGTYFTNYDTYFARYPGLTNDGTRGAGTCVDDNGNSICSVYEVTVQNPEGSATQNVTGSLTVVANGFTNLRFAVFYGSVSEITTKTNQFDVTATPGDTDDGVGTLIFTDVLGEKNEVQDWDRVATGEGVTDDGVNESMVTLEEEDTATYTIVVWLQETNSETQNNEQGASFVANITFKSAEGSEVTGLLSVGK